MPKLDLGYEPKSTIRSGCVEYETPNDMYIGVLREFLEEARVAKRKGRNYLTLKPVVFGIRDTTNSMIMLPGSNYHDPIPWLFAELFDWLAGPVVAGGQSIIFDKHRRTVYPRANGEDDWSYKSAFGMVGGEAQLDWARRHLRMDAASRSCVVTPWNWQRDLVKYTARKELELNKGEEYIRLPCITSIQFTTNDVADPADKKGLNTMVSQRALDFTGAAHCDVYRIIEASQWLATNSYPGGYSGTLTVLANTCVVESFGAGRFIEFGNLMEWWTNDETCMTILDNYEVTNQSRHGAAPGLPHNKQYDWFQAEWKKTEVVVFNAVKNQWNLFETRIADIKYQYYKEFCWAMAVFYWMLAETMADEIKQYHWDAKQVLEAQNWGSTVSMYPPFYWLGQMKSWMAYYVSAELARHFIVTQNWEKLSEVLNFNPTNKKLRVCLLLEACRFCGKRQREKLFGIRDYRSFGQLYNAIFAEAPTTEG
jgi:hypothetical protein